MVPVLKNVKICNHFRLDIVENLLLFYIILYRDPQSGLAYVELCLGRSKQDCLEMDWVRFDYSPIIKHTVQLSDGIPVYVKIKVVSTGNCN